jgi:hypothetical protein
VLAQGSPRRDLQRALVELPLSLLDCTGADIARRLNAVEERVSVAAENV